MKGFTCIFRKCGDRENFQKLSVKEVAISANYLQLALADLNTAPLIQNKEDSTQIPSYDVNTTAVNTTGVERANFVSLGFVC